MEITYLKSAALVLFKVSANRYDLGLSNELLFIILAQEAKNCDLSNLEV